MKRQKRWISWLLVSIMITLELCTPLSADEFQSALPEEEIVYAQVEAADGGTSLSDLLDQAVQEEQIRQSGANVVTTVSVEGTTAHVSYK